MCVSGPRCVGSPALLIVVNAFLESVREDSASFLNDCISTFVCWRAREHLYSPDKSTALALNKSLCLKSGHSFKHGGACVVCVRWLCVCVCVSVRERERACLS